MKPVKVHIVLKEGVQADVLLPLLRGAGVTEINERRLHRFGIASGLIDPERLSEVEKIEGVKAVVVDASKCSS